MNLIGLLLLQALISLIEGEVVTSFKTCDDSFAEDKYKRIFPIVLQDKTDRFKIICQKYTGSDTERSIYRYATLYDTSNRIPIYSAYKFTGVKALPRKDTWMIEPQLDGIQASEMTSRSNGQVGERQAVNQDYVYDRGQLYPHSHNNDQDQADSTFTLTNTAPQTYLDNALWVQQVQRRVTNAIMSNCEKTANVVTGVIPGQTFIRRSIKNVETDRVNVPSHFWSAFCCERIKMYGVKSIGYVLQMLGDGSGTLQVYNGEPNTTSQLNDFLATEYKLDSFKLFGTIHGCS